MNKDKILEVKSLKKHFLIEKHMKKENNVYVKAVDGISFDVYKGETLGIVGESGCGKSTLGRALLRLDDPTSGEVIFQGKDITKCKREEMRLLREHMQFIFQDPYSSMNPKMTIKDVISEPLDNFRKDMSASEKEEIIGELLEVVGLSKDVMNRYPHEFSGGQRQRIVIARGMALNPSIVVCDESVSALDVSVQAQVINLLNELQKKLDLTYLFISHDLRVVKHVSDRIMVLYLGQVMEIATSDELFSNPKHPYTKSLIGSISKGNPREKHNREILRGEIPSPVNVPKGCPFSTRCPKAVDKCRNERPALDQVGDEHFSACFFAEQL